METKLNEQDGLAALKCLIKEFLNSGEGSPKVREYISSVAQDDSLLLIYLRGRKQRVNQAFDTLKRNAAVRFDDYPELFPVEMPDVLSTLAKRGIYGLTKTRDKFGRRITCFNTGEWNPNELPLEEICGAATHFYDRMILDEDVINNGLIIIQNCGGMGLKHARQFSLRNMLLILNVFCLAYPIKLKGLYYVNVPSYVKYLFKIIQPFLSKKLKERMVVMGTGERFETLHKLVSPDLLPKFLGGVYENEAAFDLKEKAIQRQTKPGSYLKKIEQATKNERDRLVASFKTMIIYCLSTPNEENIGYNMGVRR